jgi:phosphoribosylaminoimidazolecarboxamide formyltransferase/IMP cyclohydrolase
MDIVAGLYLVKEFSDPACVIIKHRTPCGVASASTLKEAYLDALKTDKMSAYGGVYCFNKKIDLGTAQELIEMFVDTLIAPDFESSALQLLKEKEKMTILRREAGPDIYQEIHSVPGGFLIQDRDISNLSPDQMIEVSQQKPDSVTKDELFFAWNVVKHSRSNAIAICTGSRALGVGSGQTSRVDAVKQAIERSGDEVQGAVLASDAFFPFPDSIKLASEAGIKAIISPQGSIRDQEVVQAADEAGIILVFTKIRSFKH